MRNPVPHQHFHRTLQLQLPCGGRTPLPLSNQQSPPATFPPTLPPHEPQQHKLPLEEEEGSTVCSPLLPKRAVLPHWHPAPVPAVLLAQKYQRLPSEWQRRSLHTATASPATSAIVQHSPKLLSPFLLVMHNLLSPFVLVMHKNRSKFAQK